MLLRVCTVALERLEIHRYRSIRHNIVHSWAEFSLSLFRTINNKLYIYTFVIKFSLINSQKSTGPSSYSRNFKIRRLNFNLYIIKLFCLFKS